MSRKSVNPWQSDHFEPLCNSGALLGLRRGQKISEREADVALSNYRVFPVERQDVLPLWPRLKSLHANLSAYDAQYVALAEALNVPLITADARVKRSGVARCEVEVFDAQTCQALPGRNEP